VTLKRGEEEKTTTEITEGTEEEGGEEKQLEIWMVRIK
jgi:hypothetical protein